jgi:hypothetical protein
VLIEVSDDGAGDLAQIGGLAEQATQPVQLPLGKLVQGMSDVSLRGIAQQDQDQITVPAVAPIQPDAAALGGFGAGELATLRQPAHLLLW